MIPFWFILITILWMGFFVLEGFDFGVGILHGVAGRDDAGRETAIGTIGPLWDGNEVWLVVAAAAMFAAFPAWYATMFSGFYLVVVVLLAALIVRGVSFEFRGKRDSPRWRATWDALMVAGSLIAPFLIGLSLGDLLHGVRSALLNPVEFAAVVAALASAWFVYDGREGWAFSATTVTMAASVLATFVDLYPRVLVSSTSPAFSLTAGNSAAASYSLFVMTVVALIALPFVLGYQAWTCRFRRRVSSGRP